jgi:ATP-dependent Clp protease ATP-binding subunit ClpC
MKIKDNVLNELKKTFNPEFLNRVDEIVVFHPLEKDHLLMIVDLLVNELNKQLLDQEIFLELDQAVKEWLINKYYQPAYGARPMRRALQKEIEDLLADELLSGRVKGPQRIKAILDVDTPVFVEVGDEAMMTVG